MRIILLVLVTILSFQGKAFSAEDQIVAIVGKEPVTLSELEQRKKLMKFFNNIPTLSPEQERIFTNNILQTIIDDKVLTQYATKIHINASKNEIQNFIKNIETSNKLPAGNLEKAATHAHVTLYSLHEKIRVEVLRSKIINEIIGSQINVSKGDVDSLILDTNSRDAKLSFKVFTAKYKNDRAYKSMSKLSSKVKGCNNTAALRYHSFATMSDLDTSLSALPPNLQGIVKGMSVGQATGVIKDDKLQVFLLCAKDIQGFSDNDANQLYQIVAHKQLNSKATKFLQNLRKKAYVKILM